ncbi:MAG: putative M18 family aminopeptidase 1 [Syntrophorhabdus sp. PtaU1.Bin002]|nr:MAG: putative M18 family aminopeptidase 1 [Syntrophorhabdus sp. PtaU1.Bin002]
MTHEPGWKKKSQEERESIFLFSEGYKTFLDRAKTEREAVRRILQDLSNHGFSEDPTAGKVVQTNRGKETIAFVKGEQNPAEGCNIIVAHIDAPRLDLKQNPLYEDVGLGLLKTHYYGGIKKYQWVAMPLAIHGTIVKTDGRAVELVIGEEETDPVFSIDDLLPHLSRKTQDEKKLSEAIDGEKLTLLFGSIPVVGEEKEAVSKHILGLLGDRYGIVEEDLVSSEIEVVPAFKARDVGIDRSMVGAYGQDDRASVYPLLKAISEIGTPLRSCFAIFIDKEEIGSEGNTSMKSAFLRIFLDDVLQERAAKSSESFMRKMLFRSRALSADVNGAVNPMFQDVHEKQNACYLGYGLCVTKFTGHGGKVGANDAHAEYIAEIRRIFEKEGIIWQTGELGKIDEGGGGTVAKYLAEYGMDIVDCGAPLLTMHSPFEISSKLDIYETYRAFKAFLES